MPLFVAALLGGLINIAGSLAGRVLIALGLSAVTYTGIQASLTWLMGQAVVSMQLLSPQVLQVLAMLKVGQSLSMVASAITARLLIQGLTGDTLRRLVMA